MKYEDLKCEFCNGKGETEKFVEPYGDSPVTCNFCNGTGIDEEQLKAVKVERSEEVKKEPDERMSLTEIYDSSSLKLYNKKSSDLSDINEKLHVTQYVVALLDQLRYSYSKEDDLSKSHVILAGQAIEAQSKAGYWMNEFESLHNKTKDSQSEIESLREEVNQLKGLSLFNDKLILEQSAKIKELESKLASIDYAKEEDRKSWKNGKLSPKEEKQSKP